MKFGPSHINAYYTEVMSLVQCGKPHSRCYTYLSLFTAQQPQTIFPNGEFMQKIQSSIRPIRAFWANHEQRRTIMWVLLALSALVLVYGAYTAIDGQRQYMKGSDDVKSVQKRLTQLELPYMVEENGQTQLDLSKATQEEQMMLAMVKREELQAKNRRAEAFNQRSSGIRIIGIAIMGFALAYLFAPERKRVPAPDSTSSIPPSPDEPPFDLSN